jgi:DNA-3-methyladenine glycosylase II
MKRKLIITATSDSIKHLTSADAQFALLYKLVGELSYQLAGDPFSFIVETIIGQMLSNKVADIFTARLINICDSGKIDLDSMKRLSVKKLRSIGISQRKAQYIFDFTKTYDKKSLNPKAFSSLPDDEIIKKITFIKGLGAWSAKMFLLFVLGRENILPYEDAAFLQAFVWYKGLVRAPSKDEIKTLCEKWSPYTSIAARYLYRALDIGLTKKPFDTY